MEERIAPVIESIANHLGALGYSPTDSLVLSYFLLHPKDVTSLDIERATWLRQPQVSLSITSLKDKKLIIQASQTPGPIGRAIINYDLRCTPEELCSHLRDAIINELEIRITMLDKMGSLIKNPNAEVPYETC